VQQIEVNTSQAKAQAYPTLLKQAQALCQGETNLIANLANMAALLHQTFGWHWVGFYLVQHTELVLGPFQGPVACTRIAYGKGVCGTAWEQAKTQLVPNVHKFPGHIACSSLSQSELVVPIIKNNEVIAVLDADSDAINHFDAEDQQGLEVLCQFLAGLF
jgi:GAF domain-containing protein